MRLFLALAIAISPLSASTMFTVTGSDTDGNVSAEADFTISGSDLFIALTDDEANPTSAGQLLSDFNFALQNGSTVLTSPGTLSNTITNNGVTPPSNNGVTVVTGPSFTVTTTNTKPDSWQLTYESSANTMACDATGFCLNDLTGGQPAYMIIGPGPYTNANSSITSSHSPSLAGRVVFEIDNIPNLSSSTTVSSAVFSFGTGAEIFLPGTCTAGCGPGRGSTTPEPLTFGLVGGGLLGLRLVRWRRHSA
jgi:hypothetical protein